jgi:hypothetical protein
MKRLPMNPREDADVIRTGTFPDAIEQAAQNLSDRIIELRRFVAQAVRDAQVRDRDSSEAKGRPKDRSEA